jgi:hypothetical protein
MDWVVEKNQLMVMLLLDFGKVYRGKWEFLEGSLASLGLISTWMSWVRSHYVDSQCMVGLNKSTNNPIMLIRSIHQSYLSALFLYLYVADCLRCMLKNDDLVKVFKLSRNQVDVIDQEYADDTNLYLEGSLQNLNNSRGALEISI